MRIKTIPANINILNIYMFGLCLQELSIKTDQKEEEKKFLFKAVSSV